MITATGGGRSKRDPIADRSLLLLSAVAGGDALAARAIVKRWPAVAKVDIWTAAACGEAATLEGMLKADRRLAVRRGGPKGWEPLLYLCHSRLGAGNLRRAAGLTRALKALLKAGADPDTSWAGDPGFEEIRQSALYAATCISRNAKAARLLLEAGADPDDHESIYHAAQFGLAEMLALLKKHGVDLNDRKSPYRNTPLYFILGHRDGEPGAPAANRGVSWLLKHGADPDAPSYESKETPLHLVARIRHDAGLARLLLKHGAKVDARRADGRTPYALAWRAANEPVLAVLRKHGAGTEKLSPLDEFLGACFRGEPAAARVLRARHRGIDAEMTEEDRRMLIEAAAEGREGAVRALLEGGFEVNATGPGGGTALHHAALRGRLGCVRILVKSGASLTARDTEHNATPLEWCAWGAANVPTRGAKYPAVAQALIEAGSRVKGGGFDRGHTGVARVLKKHRTK